MRDHREEIVLDFSGVRNANSSFINALVTGIVEQHGQRVLDQLVFKGCNPVVRVLVESAIELGLHKIQGTISA
jgi:anti-anti-sigma regulatory factor